jgi:nitrite reductase/ring-hydroxylating ferredoxin subunit
MKSYLYIPLFALIISCSDNSTDNKNCRFLLNIGVNVSINMSLPQYSQLQFISNSVYVPNVGNAGIIVTNTGSGYLAWDAADPNHTPSNCSTLNVSGLNAICGCEDKNTYSLVTGQAIGNGNLICSLKNYRVEQSGTNLRIYN